MEPSGQTNLNPQPAQPSQPVQQAQPVNKPKKPKMKFAVIALVALMVLGGGFIGAQSFLNAPGRVWDRAVSNTRAGLERAVELSKEESEGYKVDASLRVGGPLAIDASLDGSLYKGSGKYMFDIGASGVRATAEVRVVAADDDEVSPDIYLKISGLDSITSLIDLLGGGAGLTSSDIEALEFALNDVNDQWFVIDRTLLDQLIATSEMASSVGSDFTQEEADEITQQIVSVVDTYLFPTDKDIAVIEVLEEYGKEDFQGVSTQKYKAGVNKENLKKMLSELNGALSDTKLADLLTEGTNQTYEEIIMLEDLLSGIDDADFSRATADVWVEASGRYVRNIRIYPVEDNKSTNYLDFAIPFEGGDEVPLVVRAVIDDTGTEGELELGVGVNSQNGDLRFWSDVDLDIGFGVRFDLKSELNFAKSDEEVSVEAPQDARNIYELIGLIDGGTQVEPSVFDAPSAPDEFDFPAFDDFEL